MFINTKVFDKECKKLDFTDSDLRSLENEILENPNVGRVVQGTGRLRKLRFAPDYTGKSGGYRIYYVNFTKQEIVYFILIYSKTDKENITKEERNLLKQLVDQLEAEL
jgi:hypothetical protein